MNSYKKNKLIFFLVIFINVILYYVYADSAFTNDTSVINITNNSVNLASASEIDEEAYREAYIEEITNAFKSVELPEVFNLPTNFIQPTYHPYTEDLFGKFSDETPIFQVNLDDNENNNLMSLTFDSAYINKYTYQLLDILDEYNIKATFFMTYEFMIKNPSQIMDIIKRGHEVGNHSTTHPDFNTLSDAKVVKEVMKAHNYIRNLVGVNMCLFRFPFGSYSPRTVALLKNMGYYPIQWTFDSIDWKNVGKEYLIDRFATCDKIEPGAIILFHNGATYTPEALPEIIEMIYDKGLKCVRVSDLIYHHDFHLRGNGKQVKGRLQPDYE